MTGAKVPLRRLFSIVNGGTPSSDSSNWTGDVLWATPVDLAKVDGHRISTTQRTLSEDGLTSGSRAVPPSSLIISTRAPIGYVAETDERMAFNQGCRALVPTCPVDVRYFRYQLASSKEVLQSLGQGSTFVELTSEMLGSLPVNVPSVSTQRAIADYLDTETTRIDTLITKKRHLIQLLEERSQAYEGNLLRSSRTAKLKHLSTVRPGYAFSSTNFGPDKDGVRLLRGINVGVGSVDWTETVRLSEDAEEPDGFELQGGDVVIGMDRPFIKAGTRSFVYQYDSERTLLVQRVCRLRPDIRTMSMLLLSAIQSTRFSSYIESDLTGISVPHLSDEQIGNFEVPIFEPGCQTELSDLISDQRNLYHRLVDAIAKQIALLSEYRQALITAAVTGEMEIPGVGDE